MIDSKDPATQNDFFYTDFFSWWELCAAEAKDIKKYKEFKPKIKKIIDQVKKIID